MEMVVATVTGCVLHMLLVVLLTDYWFFLHLI